MTMESLVAKIKENPDFDGVGMILCHNGVVRRTTRDGREVDSLEVRVDHDILAGIVEDSRKREGILDVLVHVHENRRLYVGDDVMYIVVAGDIRENVISTLSYTLDRVKSEATEKTQYYI
ncbi:MAG: molybdenum cofactor biosynthesis protein MoaE [Desulfobacteraceae bacterium]